ncbi:Kazal-type serine protease inhibitor domain-containing protein [Shinella sp. BYT-45]|uniref:Kazal-type serine protease inhibitor domain-containing protein n=1 Tax=Shinella sp. BYT-45 TaxID=3377377 RepID=UPI003980FEC9
MPSMSPLFRRLAGRIAILLAAGTLAACSVEADQGAGGHRPRPQACTMEYLPVCGARGNDLQTFANACEARSSGYRIVGRGECRHGGWPDPRPDEGRACTREYAPVCGARGRDRQTFANACEARRSGYDILGRGECQGRRPDGDWGDGRDRDRDRPDWRDRDRDRGDQRVCTMEYNPVCGQRGRDRRTFGNACSAGSEGYQVVHPGECRG